MTLWPVWVAWLALFAAVEIPAAFNNRSNDTFSEFVWGYLTRPGRWWTWPARLLLIMFFGWLTGHLVFHLWWL